MQCLHLSQDSSLIGQAPDAKIHLLQLWSHNEECLGKLSVAGSSEPVSRSPTWDRSVSSLAFQHGQHEQSPKPQLPLFNNYAWLGLLVTLIEGVAGDYVCGPFGSDGRPKVVFNISLIQSLDAVSQLPQACQVRWLKFLQIWERAGWVLPCLELADDLRPLQYGSGLRKEDVQDVTAHRLSQCIAEFCKDEGWDESVHLELKDFLIVVQQNFSDPAAVLLPAKGVQQRLHGILR